MRLQFTLLCYIILSAPFTSFSQGKKFVYYFDNNLNPVEKSKSVFKGSGFMEDGLLSLQIVDNNTQQTVILAHYIDSSLKINHGSFQSFFITGIKASEGNYVNNKEDGLWKKWDKTGMLIDSTIYDDGKKINSATFDYNKKGQLKSIDITDIKNDREERHHYNDSGKLVSEVFFIGQRGILKNYNKEGVKLDTVFSREEIEASYPGGDVAWAKYIKSQIVKNIDAIARDGNSGICRLRFIIDKDGKPNNVVALTMKGTVLADVAVMAVKNGPRWNPAVQYGRPVNAYREQPVSFYIQDK